ncbi:kelch domain-containing protein 10-like [Tropilaelaps mercedesae]|uniref:Kelch domain-containing protein 10-like n=1 Tax=Tropilaelaps mercedesae TaxID=418985 RepID=A0A1V9XQW2_9ACAR|nr:kelch domain-containing protein 10-like [Tropilaelaps mercedesae]
MQKWSRLLKAARDCSQIVGSSGVKRVTTAPASGSNDEPLRDDESSRWNLQFAAVSGNVVEVAREENTVGGEEVTCFLWCSLNGWERSSRRVRAPVVIVVVAGSSVCIAISPKISWPSGSKRIRSEEVRRWERQNGVFDDCTDDAGTLQFANDHRMLRRTYYLNNEILPIASCHLLGKLLPPRLSGHRVVCTDQYLYSFGGYAPLDVGENNVVIELWRFHFYRKTWKKIPLKGDVPEQVASSAVALLHGRILILLGGTGVPFGEVRSRDVYSCFLDNPDENGAVTWIRWKTHGEAPLRLYGQAITIHDDYLYMVGGTDGLDYTIDVHRLHLRDRRWERLSNYVQGEPIPPRYRHEIAYFDNQIYVFGGGTPHYVYGFDMLPALDLKTSRWIHQPTKGWRNPHSGHLEVPKPRRCHSVVQSACGNWIVLAGGVDRNETLDDIWKLHLPTLRWHRYNCRLPKKLYFHSAAMTTTGCMYVFGGVLDSYQHRSNDLYAMNVSVPTLQELALDIAMRTYPRLKMMDENQLNQIHIPKFIRHKFFAH